MFDRQVNMNAGRNQPVGLYVDRRVCVPSFASAFVSVGGLRGVYFVVIR